jgi:hypothetical protein
MRYIDALHRCVQSLFSAGVLDPNARGPWHGSQYRQADAEEDRQKINDGNAKELFWAEGALTGPGSRRA